MNWKAGTAVTLGVAALGLTGCVEFEGEIKGKQVSNKEVQIKFQICDDRTDTCNPQMMNAARGSEETRVLIAIRAPKGTDMPKDFQPRGIDIMFNGSNSYTSEMNEKASRRGDEKWHGYVSEDISGQSATEAKFKLIMGLPNNPGNQFKYRPVVGYQNGMPSDTVTCAEDVQDSFNDGDTSFVCVDDPDTNPELNKSLKIELD